MATQTGYFNVQELTDAGAPLVGGMLYTYDYGTTTPKTAYTDAAGLIPHTYTLDANLVPYIALNARGELPAPLYLSTGSYDLALKRADGSTVWTRRADASDLALSSGSSLVGFIQSGSGAVTRTAQSKEREQVSPEDFGAVGDGSTNDYTKLVAMVAAHPTHHLAPSVYKIGTNLNFGSDSVFGKKGSTIKGKGISFNTGADFYDSKVSHLQLDGTGSGGAENGLKLSQGHRVLLDSVVAQNYLQGFWLTNSYVCTLFNLRSALNSYGGLIEENSNALLLMGSSFTNNTNAGLTIRGSYSVTSFSVDYEQNGSDGLVFSNAAGTGAESRSNRSIADYFEGNTNRDIIIGDQASAEVCRYTLVAWNFYQAGAGTNIGISVDRSDRAILLWNRFAQNYAITKYFLRANSSLTTIVPFPQGDSSIADTEITVEVGATVSHQTIQYNVTSITADGAGAGFVDIFFKAPYATVPPLVLQFYSTTDRITAAPTLLLNSVTVSGFRVRVIGAGAGEVVKFSWRAGA